MGAIGRLVKLLLEYTELLDGLKPEDLGNAYMLNAAIHLLQVQAQSLIDIILRASSLLGFGAEGYIDAGVKLKDAGLLSNDEFNRYRAVVRFRNIVIHQYGIVDPNVVVMIVRNREYRELVKIGLKIHDELRRRGLDP